MPNTSDVSKSLSIIAYYLSEYDMEAVHALGFETQAAAFKHISSYFGRENNYLKLRRDEFDALPNSSSHRKGWRNRPPAKEVVNIASRLNEYSFDELTNLVKSMLSAQASPPEEGGSSSQAPGITLDYPEEVIEQLLNYTDHSAGVRLRVSPTKTRVYNRSVIEQLKFLYQGKCQLCGCESLPGIAENITEVHHIEYFSMSHNNNPSNLIVLCPNHHRLIHKTNPSFDRENGRFIFEEGFELKVTLNYHL